MTTDTDALQERIEHALWGVTQVYDARDGRGTEVGVHAPVHTVVAAVLPIIAAEVKAAKADAWDDCERSLYRWFNDPFAGDAPPRNPYHTIETGGRA